MTAKGNTSKVYRPTTDDPARVTVPRALADALNLRGGTLVSWTISPVEPMAMIMRVRGYEEPKKKNPAD